MPRSTFFHRLGPLLVSAAVVSLAVGCGGASPTNPTPPSVQFTQTDLVIGTGAVVALNQNITVHYTGWLYNDAAADKKGLQVDSTAGGNPISFGLTPGALIEGWIVGVPGMRVGGTRRLIIPGSMAYPAGRGVIPPGWPLIFDIQLVSIQ